MDRDDPKNLVNLGIDSLTERDVEIILTAEETGIKILHDGETFVAPSSEKVTLSRPRARYMAHREGALTEITFQVSFVISPEDLEDDDDENNGRVRGESWPAIED